MSATRMPSLRRPHCAALRTMLRRVGAAVGLGSSLCALLLLSGSLHAQTSASSPRVFAAASLTNALDQIAAQWQASGHAKPLLAYGGSSALAKQIDAGAPAEVFVSADTSWMDYLDTRKRLAPGSRADLLGNTLVLIAPADTTLTLRATPGTDIAKAFSGKLCTGEPGVVPVGIYAKQSLQALGWWVPLQGRIVGTEDVRSALAFVERGECALGIVYATDAKSSRKVRVLATLPAATHASIVYPVALLQGARPEARAFVDYLRTSLAARVTFERLGFRVLGAATDADSGR